MRNKIFQEVLDEAPKEVEIFVRLYADLVLLINSVLKEKGLTQKALADQMDKRPSEIHKWLSGEHNFTLRSLAKLEAELGVKLIEVPKPHKTEREFAPNNRPTLHVCWKKEVSSQQEDVIQVDWVNASTMEQTYKTPNAG